MSESERPHVANGDCALCHECQGRAAYRGDYAHCQDHIAYDDGFEDGVAAGRSQSEQLLRRAGGLLKHAGEIYRPNDGEDRLQLLVTPEYMNLRMQWFQDAMDAIPEPEHKQQKATDA